MPVIHGHRSNDSLTPTYMAWQTMWSRVRSDAPEKRSRYKDRGITVCAHWKSFVNFLADMGERPKGLTIDRIDNNGHYEPSNCRWATPSEQASNRSTNRLIPYEGEVLTLNQVAERTGIDRCTLEKRLAYGWPLQKALSTKKRTYQKVES